MKRSNIMVISLLYGAALCGAEKQNSGQAEPDAKERDVKVRAAFSPKDMRDAAAWNQAYMVWPTTEGSIAIVSWLPQDNPKILQIKHAYNQQGMDHTHDLSPLEATTYWVARLEYLLQPDMPMMNVFQKIVTLDNDNQRRVNALLWGINWFSSNVVTECLRVGTVVSQAPQVLVKYVDRCKALTKSIESYHRPQALIKEKEAFFKKWDAEHASIKEAAKQKEHSKRKDDFTAHIDPQITAAWSTIGCEAHDESWRTKLKTCNSFCNNMLIIVASLLQAKADVSGVAKIRNRPHADMSSCLPCTLIFNRVDDEREAREQAQALPAPSAPSAPRAVSFYPALSGNMHQTVDDEFGKTPKE